MKKLFVLLFVLVPVLFCFAKEQRGSLELGIGHYSITETQGVSGIKVKTKAPSIAFNLSGVALFTDNAGIGVYGNLLLPKEFRVTAMGETIIVDRSAYDFLFAMDFLVGPTLIMFKNEKFCFPLSLGFHWYQIWANTDVSKLSSSQIGVGANITGEYHFNSNLYVYSRFQFTFDFFSWDTIRVNRYGSSSSKSSSGNVKTLGIMPCIGIAFKF